MPSAPLVRRGRWWTLPWLKLRQLDRRELQWLLVGLGACLFLLIFLKLAGEVTDGDTLAFDTKILKALRSPTDPSKPIGPEWVESTLFDLTAIGGPAVLFLVVFAVVGFLLFQARYRTALLVWVACISAEFVTLALKNAFNRPRPAIVPHLRVAFSTSFPSGHAMESAIVYLTLGALLMRFAESRVTKLYCLGMAMLLTAVVGVSRVYLGVHYPTDVIGGWLIGFMWASICWLAAQHFEGRTGITAEKAKVEEVQRFEGS